MLESLKNLFDFFRYFLISKRGYVMFGNFMDIKEWMFVYFVIICFLLLFIISLQLIIIKNQRTSIVHYGDTNNIAKAKSE